MFEFARGMGGWAGEGESGWVGEGEGGWVGEGEGKGGALVYEAHEVTKKREKLRCLLPPEKILFFNL